MSPEVQSFESLIYAGRFPVWLLVIGGLLAAAVIGLLAWRESRSRARWVAGLAILRWTALVILLWMLAEPTLSRTVRRSRMKSMVVLADASASMTTTDDATSIDSRRWAMASNGVKDAFTSLDEAAASVELVQANLSRVISPKSTDDSRNNDALAQFRRTLDDCSARLKRLPGLLVDAAKAEATSIENQFSTLSPRLTAMAGDASSLAAAERTKRMESLSGDLLNLRSRLARLAEVVPSPGGGPVTAQQRSQMMGQFLDRAETSWLPEVTEGARILRYRFDNRVSPMPSGAWGNALSVSSTAQTTDLTAAFERVTRDAAANSIEAVVLLSDGAHNASRDPVKLTASLGDVPVYVVPIGDTRPVRDVMLHHVKAPQSVFVNDSIVVEGTIDAHEAAGETLSVQLMRGEDVLSTQSVPIATASAVRKVLFTTKADQVGRESLTVRVVPIAGERVAENNVTQVDVDVLEDKIRLLLADHYPRWEFRYLRNLWRRDETVEFQHVLFDRRDAKPAELPATIEEWSKWRVVVLGDMAPEDLPTAQQELIERYVGQRGGTLVVIAGDNAMPATFARGKLGDMLPVTRSAARIDRENGYDLFLTAEGRASAAMQLSDDLIQNERVWRELTSRLPVYDLSPFCRPKPTARVLIGARPRGTSASASGDVDSAFLCWQYYGTGRVVYLSAPSTYRLRHLNGDEYHHRFWGQLLRWAIAKDIAGGSRTVRLMSDKPRYAAHETAQVTVRLGSLTGGTVANAACQIIAQQDGKTLASVDMTEDTKVPGAYRATLKNLPTGQVTLRVDGPQVRSLLSSEGVSGVQHKITIEPPDSAELRDTRCNLPLLKQLASAAHGQVVPPTALQAVLSNIDFKPSVSETVTNRPLWTQWVYLWIFVGCLAVEWVVRKLVGLA